MKTEHKFLIVWTMFIAICFMVSLLISMKSNYENTEKIIELQNQKEVLEIEQQQLFNLLK